MQKYIHIYMSAYVCVCVCVYVKYTTTNIYSFKYIHTYICMSYTRIYTPQYIYIYIRVSYTNSRAIQHRRLHPPSYIFHNGPEDQGSIPSRVMPNLKN